MLVGTPVVGSGAGGMEELLLGGGQIICKDPQNIKECVTEALLKASSMIKTGKEYAQQFSKEQFEQEWQELISKLN
jgi:glycosyltransferase involved in cell wall biosynthesis